MLPPSQQAKVTSSTYLATHPPLTVPPTPCVRAQVDEAKAARAMYGHGTLNSTILNQKKVWVCVAGRKLTAALCSPAANVFPCCQCVPLLPIALASTVSEIHHTVLRRYNNIRPHHRSHSHLSPSFHHCHSITAIPSPSTISAPSSFN